jgi:hypothetical protein
MMSEEKQLEEISIKVDEFLLKLLQEYKLTPLNISAIIVGRVYMFNESTGSVEEFKQLIEHVLEVTPKDYKQTGTSNEKLH